MKKYFKKNTRGFTLVETIIYTAIIGIVLASFAAFVLAIAANRNKNYASAEVQANAVIIMSFIAEKIRTCEGVISPAAGNESAVLELDMPNSAENFVFSAADGVLYAGAGETFNISSSEVAITNLQFNNLSSAGGKDNIAIALSLKYRNDSSPEYDYSFDMQTAVSVRL